MDIVFILEMCAHYSDIFPREYKKKSLNESVAGLLFGFRDVVGLEILLQPWLIVNISATVFISQGKHHFAGSNPAEHMQLKMSETVYSDRAPDSQIPAINQMVAYKSSARASTLV